MTTRQRKTLSDLYRTWVCGPRDRYSDCRKLDDLTMAESKSHDRYRGRDISRGMTVTEESRYFTLKRLAEFAFAGEEWSAREPEVAGFFHYQHSVYGAYALVHDLGTADAVGKWAEANRAALYELMTWNYAEMIRS